MRARIERNSRIEITELHVGQYGDSIVTIEFEKPLSLYEIVNLMNSKYGLESGVEMEYHTFYYDMERYSYTEALSDALKRIEIATKTGYIDLQDLDEGDWID